MVEELGPCCRGLLNSNTGAKVSYPSTRQTRKALFTLKAWDSVVAAFALLSFHAQLAWNLDSKVEIQSEIWPIDEVLNGYKWLVSLSQNFLNKPTTTISSLFKRGIHPMTYLSTEGWPSLTHCLLQLGPWWIYTVRVTLFPFILKTKPELTRR